MLKFCVTASNSSLFSARITSYNVCYTKLLRSNLNNIKISKDNQNEIPFYGPSYNDSDYMNAISKFNNGILWTKFDNFELTCKDAASEVASDSVIGWFQGRMEYGPRALGARSIVANPISRDIV